MRGRNGVLVGWERDDPSTFGFGVGAEAGRPADNRLPLVYEGDGPICCIAPTGAGKGRDFLVPVLLTWPGSVICIDIKGELHAVTARARRALGQRVAVLDPFGVTGAQGDRMNPFDLFDLDGSILDCDAEMLAAQVAAGHEFTTEPFWTDTASGLISGLIAHIATAHTRETRNLTALRSYLYSDDLSYQLAVLLDAKKYRSEFVRDEFVGFLHHCAERTRDSVLSTATTYVKALGSTPVAKALETSTIDLADVIAGRPLSIYIVIPPGKLKSHRALTRLWVSTLLTAVMSRKAIPERRTLFVLDEAAQLGAGFEPLLTAATLLRGYGLQLVTCWQDVSQIKSRYPADWQSILNNAGVLLMFGIGHYAAARESAELIGMPPHELTKLGEEDAALSVRGEGTRTIRRLNYLRDPLFAGKFDPNPYFARVPLISR
jgi:type IV secretion system protein VirD4